jgi:hypothetical protein
MGLFGFHIRLEQKYLHPQGRLRLKKTAEL